MESQIKKINFQKVNLFLLFFSANCLVKNLRIFMPRTLHEDELGRDVQLENRRKKKKKEKKREKKEKKRKKIFSPV